MVKRFRRSAAGDDEQVPSDIRTPNTLRRTLDYLVDKLIGGPERLAVVHKFVWDRTRAIRNDFSIQQVSKEEDVRTAVECFERIARFHIMALHHLSNPANLLEGENFDVFQEREQLNNTLLSLVYYYDDHRGSINFPNEAEFRAYHIILAFSSQHPDLEDRIQSWPLHLLADGKVQTALRLYQAAGSTLFSEGPLRPTAPFPIARNNSANFWAVMQSGAVGYTLACITEMHFNRIRFGALDALWRSCKSAPSAQRAKFRDWTLEVMSEYLGFDTEEQTVDFCAALGLQFDTDAQGVTYLNMAGSSETYLDRKTPFLCIDRKRSILIRA
jgi:nuclear mRNA export protein SAC3